MSAISRRGFTLIEMLVVVAIIGLLSSIIIVGLGSSRAKARDARRLSDVQQIIQWAELNYQHSGGGYPPRNDPNFPNLTDPQGRAYYYTPTTERSQTADVGACLEGSSFATSSCVGVTQGAICGGGGGYTPGAGYVYCRRLPF